MKKIKIKWNRNYLTIILVIIEIVIVSCYSKKNYNEIINYSKYADIDYKVELRSNNFFEKNYLPSNKQYVNLATDNVLFYGTINYRFSKDVEVSYINNYKVSQIVKYNSTEKNLYEKSEVISEDDNHTLNSCEKYISIPVSFKLNFQQYNDEIGRVIKGYSLKGYTSNINVEIISEIKIKFSGDDKYYDDSLKSSFVVNIAENTFDIKKGEISFNNDNLYHVINHIYEYNYILKILFTIFFILLLIINYKYFGLLLKRVKTFLENYKKTDKMSKIIKKYDDQITEIQTFNLKLFSKRIYVSKIDSLLDIKDIVESPLLLNVKRKYAYFFVVDGDVLYYTVIKL